MVSMDVPKNKKVLRPDTCSIDYGVSTHTGRQHLNQDAVRVASAPVSLNDQAHLFAVADGMGGHPGGGLAGRLAAERFL